MKQKISKPRTQKGKTIIFSILIAVIIWLMVIVINDPMIKVTINNLDVKFVNEAALRENNLVVVNKDKMPELSVVVAGSRSNIMNYMDSIFVQVDVGNIDKEGSYNISGTLSIPYSKITLEKENYDEIPVTVEALATKDINVSVKQIGSGKDKLVQSVINDPKITITGAESEIEKITGAVATLDVADIDEDGTDTLKFSYTDEAGNPIDRVETVESSRSEVDVINTVYEMKTLPVVAMLTAEMDRAYILKEDKTVVTPSTVTVGVEPSNTDDRVIVYIDNPPADGNGEYELAASGGMYIPPESKKVKVKTEIVKKGVAQLELTVQPENVAAGLTAKVDEILIAQVWGEEGKISTDAVKATVDLNGLGVGEYVLPVAISGQNVGFRDNYTVHVTIE